MSICPVPAVALLTSCAAAGALAGPEAPPNAVWKAVAWPWVTSGPVNPIRAPTLHPRAWGHSPAVVPPMHGPAHGQQDEEGQQVHGCQRHVAAAGTEGSLPLLQQPSAHSSRVARGARGPGADVTELLVPGAGHGGLGGWGGMGGSKQEGRQQLGSDTPSDPAGCSACTTSMCGPRCWQQRPAPSTAH